ncbi:ImmA/IrrE family metallo-endopeptidase [Bradyrhizobium tropiciagri]|uniref:ImmA/IrrE family metallo-endopeptidase n=1 Tax=Bradyrhizobium tropiciagri TaxID=312253 RepID=UPI001BAD0C3D|nr:ImmA/IrrE family metallo-endopeptidase [Bradyrhizobium tropiciagri]MBR0896812.1 ImmA/IrrE family metallo-endopeptidase [Bradyrhizobium tropiciagri]
MASHQAERAAATFWRKAGGRAAFGLPVDMAAAAPAALPLSVVGIPDLDSSAVGRMSARTGSPWAVGNRRQLRGCLLADLGVGLVFVDSNDPEDEQRFTVAHEVAHFILHYLGPRERALATLGPGIAAVLDRLRPPTTGERLSAALRDVPVEPFRHAMDRGLGGRHAGLIERIEGEADDLAVELIAPWRELTSVANMEPGIIRVRFGLPQRVAARLAALAASSGTSKGVLGIFAKK